jgi:V8-like Glu-specific endopeptidase
MKTTQSFYCLTSSIVLSLATFVPPAPAAPAVKPPSLENSQTAAATKAYWTATRLRAAKPLPMPKVNKSSIRSSNKFSTTQNPVGRDGKAPSVSVEGSDQPLFKPSKKLAGIQPSDVGTSGAQYSSTRLIPLKADKQYPYSTVGQLFFTVPGQGDFLCSASVINRRIILTAGHCVSDGKGKFYTNWKFVPATRNGSAPFGTWNWAYVTTTPDWFNGGGGVPSAADYAMIEAADNASSQRIGDITGWLGWQTVSLIPNHVNLLGYPCNLDSCAIIHQVTAGNFRFVGPNDAEYGSDMTGGSSGGPWVQNFGTPAVGQPSGLNSGFNRVVGITSYVYNDPAFKVEGSSIPDSRFVTLLNFICGHRTGNCS